jgi:predicted O-methyltransferase YrrM
MGKNAAVSDTIEHYVTAVIARETPVQERLRLETARLPESMMQTTPDQVAFLAMLVRATGGRRVLEIGTFTGYSALAMASALSDGGRLYACDVSREWTAMARRYWQEAGVDGRIDLHIGPAAATLDGFLAQGMAGTFDFVFIDADKTGYDAYYEAALKLLRPGGIVALDNMLWGGAVADPARRDPDTSALRALNAKIRDDDRVDCSLLTVADGVMLAQKR